MRWQVREAGQRFSEVLRAAEGGEPQILTRDGEEVAVVIDIAAYRRLRGEPPGFMDYLMSGPLLDEDLNPGRGNELPRDIDLVG